MLSGLVKKASKDAGTTGTGTTVQFVYDTQGKPFMLRMNGKTDYFYLYNGLGDITGLVDSSNQVVVRYQYNSWGKVTSTQDTSGVSLATLNPFRYRKYVYDPETGLYCLQEKKKKEVVLLPKEKDLKREKLRKKPQNEQIKPRIQL